jgi:DinB superfamily
MEETMSTSSEKVVTVEPGVESRVLREGYGPGAWHGPDLKAALADVTSALAFWRPGPGRHNIAEIALHHAYCARSVRAQMSGRPSEPFVLPGEDWFAVDDERTMSWEKIRETVDAEQQRLGELIGTAKAGAVNSPIADEERFGLVLGITCHAIYHAGQVQVIKRLRSS